jgi:phosphoglycolate phosphatase
MPSLLICDLDGTLVDSYPGIAEALLHASASVGVALRRPPDRSIVGPPLDELLRAAVGQVDAATFARLREAFVAAYDGGACRLATPFAGVPEMLDAVRAAGHVLALATNKRLAPTRAILDALGWTSLFAAVETVDSSPGGQRTKSRMLMEACAAVAAGRLRPVYLGDTAADVRAARDASIPCILATWGYDTRPQAADCVARTPATVIELLRRAEGATSLQSDPRVNGQG